MSVIAKFVFYTCVYFREVAEKVITIGEEDCDSDDLFALCNGPLHSNKEYWFVSFFDFMHF